MKQGTSNRRAGIYGLLSKIMVLVLLFSMFCGTAYASDNGILDTAKQVVKYYYVEDIPDSVINSAGSIDDLVKSLNDPYSAYFTAKEYEQFINGINLQIVGIGINTDIVTEGVLVASVIKGTPAEAAGIKEGDIIVESDGHVLAGMPSEEALSYIRGDEGTVVHIKVKRGDTFLTYDITRALVSTPSVEGQMIDGHIAYLEVSSFGENTYSEFGRMLRDFNLQNPDGYIVDLRNNPGGYVDTAVNMVGFFAGAQTALVTKDKWGSQSFYLSPVTLAGFGDKPVALLVNGYSASASEILAGAVKDYGRAVIIGDKTYGKGVMQSMFMFNDGSVLKITTNKFYSPHGNVIQKQGIIPDLSSGDIDPVLMAELLFGKCPDPVNKTGYIRLSNGWRQYEISLDTARQPEFWDAYRRIMESALNSGFDVRIGTWNGWCKVPSGLLEDEQLLYFSDHYESGNVEKVASNEKLTLTFAREIDASSVDNSSIELIDSDSGARVPLELQLSDSTTVAAVPKENLVPGEKYFLAAHRSIKDKQGNNLNIGVLNEIVVNR